MIKNILLRAANSFMYSVGISAILQMLLLTFVEGLDPVLPEFGAHFPDMAQAVLAQCLLIGVGSAAFGAGSVIMELEKIGLIVQSVLYFVLTAAVWIPIACICWGIHKYSSALVTVLVSYMVSYAISWAVQLKICKKNVEEINARLSVINGQIGD